MKVDCPVSVGELLDKISILEIKTEKITDLSKKSEAQKEYDLLQESFTSLKQKNPSAKWSKISLYQRDLKRVNLTLWDIEDQLRELEKREDFSQDFIDLARMVYKTNDQRFRFKNKINQLLGSNVKEVKSYVN